MTNVNSSVAGKPLPSSIETSISPLNARKALTHPTTVLSIAECQTKNFKAETIQLENTLKSYALVINLNAQSVISTYTDFTPTIDLKAKTLNMSV